MNPILLNMSIIIRLDIHPFLTICLLLTCLLHTEIQAQSAGSDYEGLSSEPREWPEPTHYISPNGSDDDRGTSPNEAWMTFDHALRHLRPGDVLGVMDGVYRPEKTGLLHIDGGHRGNARTGLPDNPITVRAVNERKPLLESDGLMPGIYVARNRFWNVLGLTVTGEDKATEEPNPLHQGSPGMESVFSLVEVNRSSHITLKRILASHSNRLGVNNNNHIYLILNSRNVLVEESEAYKHHRHAFLAWQTEKVTFRRCYIHPRKHYKGVTHRLAGQERRFADEAVAFYRGAWGLVENCINEGTNVGFHAHGGDTFTRALGGSYNEFYGNIGLNNYHASRVDARYAPYFEAKPAIGNKFVDFLVIGQRGVGLWHSSATQSYNRNITLYGGTGTGFRADERGDDPPCAMVSEYGGCTFTLHNALAFDNDGSGLHAEDQDEFLIEYSNAWANTSGNFAGKEEDISDHSGPIQQSMSVRPEGMGLEKGECIVFVPESSNMKGAGKNGADIGANILYRYHNRTLTDKPLWDPASGEFPHGALVEGINDLAGASLFDVHKRLNVNTNGCRLPY